MFKLKRIAVVLVTELGLTAAIVGGKSSLSWFYQSASDRYRCKTTRKQYKESKYINSQQGGKQLQPSNDIFAKRMCRGNWSFVFIYLFIFKACFDIRWISGAGAGTWIKKMVHYIQYQTSLVNRSTQAGGRLLNSLTAWMKGSLSCGSKEGIQESNNMLQVRSQRAWNILAATQLKEDFHLFSKCCPWRIHPPSSKRRETAARKPKCCVHIWALISRSGWAGRWPSPLLQLHQRPALALMHVNDGSSGISCTFDWPLSELPIARRGNIDAKCL